MTVGDKIQNMRKARGWSQEDLADRVGVTRQAISRWESNTAKPDADKIISICDLFGVSADYLLRDKYSGEGDLEGQQEPTIIRSPTVTAMQILGILLIISSVLVICAMGIMSAIEPHIYSLNGVDYRGILGYIMGNRLWWMVNLDICLLVAGVILLIGNKIINGVCFVAKKALPSKEKSSR